MGTSKTEIAWNRNRLAVALTGLNLVCGITPIQ